MHVIVCICVCEFWDEIFLRGEECENLGKCEIFHKMINYRYGTSCKPENLSRSRMTKRTSLLNFYHEI